MLSKKIQLTLLLLISIFTHNEAWSNSKHALLVGINDYPIKPLQGPQFDVIAIKHALKNNMGFEAKNIVTLLNENATKSNILNALDDLVKNTKKGDQVFIYFSGHGTSASDNNFNYPLPTTSGAFIPYDVIPESPDKKIQPKLIVGRNDLRPRLERLDQGGRSVFVVMDACYSGNAVRGVQTTFTLTERFMNIDQALSARGIEVEWDNENNKAPKVLDSADYPYKNIYFISAAGEHEVALEITESRLSDYPTIDGKPHGAFTDSLLRVFNDPLSSDQDRDGSVSYAELRSSLRAQMEARKFTHAPQGLPSLSQDKSNINNKTVLLWASTEDKTSPPAAEQKKEKIIKKEAPKKVAATPAPKKPSVKLKQKSKLLYLDQSISLSSIPEGIELTTNLNDADFSLVALKELHYAWVSASGDIIRKLKSPSEQEIAKQLSFFMWQQEIKSLATLGAQAIQLDLLGNGKGTTARNNESIGFGVNLNRGGQLILINADSSGMLSVLYPANSSEFNKFDSGSIVKLPNFATIQAPFGQDTLIAIVVTQDLPIIKEIANQSFMFNSKNSKELFKQLQTKDHSAWGLDYLTLVTTP